MNYTMTNTPPGPFQIELHRGDNWTLWKRRVTTVLRRYVEGTLAKPIPVDAKAPITAETNAIDEWIEKDAKAQTQIELTILNPSLPKLWNQFTAAYFGASGGISSDTMKSKIILHELSAIPIEEACQHHEKRGSDSAMLAQGPPYRGERPEHRGERP